MSREEEEGLEGTGIIVHVSLEWCAEGWKVTIGSDALAQREAVN